MFENIRWGQEGERWDSSFREGGGRSREHLRMSAISFFLLKMPSPIRHLAFMSRWWKQRRGKGGRECQGNASRREEWVDAVLGGAGVCGQDVSHEGGRWGDWKEGGGWSLGGTTGHSRWRCRFSRR